MVRRAITFAIIMLMAVLHATPAFVCAVFVTDRGM